MKKLGLFLMMGFVAVSATAQSHYSNGHAFLFDKANHCKAHWEFREKTVRELKDKLDPGTFASVMKTMQSADHSCKDYPPTAAAQPPAETKQQ